ncbi:signal peptidase I [Anaerostipes sp. MSJ-23]|uniref:signal peptidase I n=1 Tax=unclassified Anaerostipes TaxID=2635253 RepID=UPI001C11F9F1|nr:signal peptidase I [Anaerostipes sp. MSJ-23]MBU5459719.1 signal peptidase I [Anaerostipes sp. MSJ-23]
MKKEAKKEQKKTSWKKEAFSWVLCIVITILITEFITNFVIINANIPSGSMENTIMTNDKLIALRTSYWFNDPKRGDIIIFKYPENEKEWYIKRVIALPGETVQVKDGKVYINHSKKPLNEPYIKEEPVDDFGPYTVPKNGYFVMGDNRNCSSDAREWKVHYVSRDEILGKAWLRYYPSFKWIK